MSFQDKSAKVMVIDQSGAVRQLMTDVVRTAGYESVRGVATIKDAIGVLEVEPVDWILSPLQNEKGQSNAMQLLMLISERQVLKKTRVSLILEESEEIVLKKAFELGMLSYFQKPFNKDSLQKAIEEFLAAFEQCGWSDSLLAGNYLRQLLKTQKSYKNLLDLEKNLLGVYPGDLDILLSIAEPQAELDMKDKARSTISQVYTIDQDMEEKCRKVAGELFGEEEADKILSGPGEGSEINTLGLKSCVIIDPDDSSRKIVAEALKSLGVEEVTEFENGEGAWEWMGLQKSVDLVFQEWRIPKVTGPVFVQRVRNKFPTTPVITVSSLLKDEDQPLTQEMGVSSIVTKPIDSKVMIRTISRVIQEDRLPTKVQVLENKIRNLLSAGKHEEAAKARQTFVESRDLPEFRKKMIDAEFAYAAGKYEEARDLAVDVIKSRSDSIMTLNFIGKCLMQLNDYVAALKCLKKAQAMSPMNITRLCAIAEASSEIGDTETADKALEQADKIDGDSDQVKGKRAEIAVSEGDVKEAKKILSRLSNISEVISYLNNKAVASAKSGLLDEAMELYERTQESVPDDKKEIRAIVAYNHGLGLAKMDRYDESKKVLQEALNCGETRVSLKCKALLSKIKKAMETGKSITFNEDKGDKGSGEGGGDSEKASKTAGGDNIKAEHNLILAAVEINPGELCLFKVFTDLDPKLQDVEQMLDQKIRFAPREAVAREEAAGLERMLKSGA